MNDQKTLYRVAKDIKGITGISLQAVNKRVKNELARGKNRALIDNTTQSEKDGKASILLNDVAVKAVYRLYNLDDLQVSQPVSQPVDQPVDEALTAVIDMLREQLDRKDEQIAALTKLVENTQVLLQTEQGKSNPALLAPGGDGSGREEVRKRGFLGRVFHIGK